MTELRRFIVLGLGSFGTALAQRLRQNGARVTGVDRSQQRVEALKDVLYEAVVGNVTEREALEPLGLDQADAVFISLGERIEPSLLAALHAKELGARRMVVKAVTDAHGKLLASLGVQRIVFPEVEFAFELADRETWPNVLDFLPIDAEHSVVEVATPAALAGETLREADLRRRYGIHVLGIKDALTGRLDVLPEPDVRLSEDFVLLVLGRKEALEKFRKVK